METPKKQSKDKPAGGRLVVIRIRGTVRQRPDIKLTLTLLKLLKKNSCTVLSNTPSALGMLRVAKDYVTWGELDEETYKLLMEKRGQKDPKDPKKMLNTFHLNPPRGGYGRKGVKQPFSIGGALGDRGAKINDLLKRML